MEKMPPKREILHSFMLWYQEKYNRAASLAQMASYCPLWKSGRQGAYHTVKALAKNGLVKQRQVNEPGQRAHKKWWALEICEGCESVIKEKSRSELVSHLCAECREDYR